MPHCTALIPSFLIQRLEQTAKLLDVCISEACLPVRFGPIHGSMGTVEDWGHIPNRTFFRSRQVSSASFACSCAGRNPPIRPVHRNPVVRVPAPRTSLANKTREKSEINRKHPGSSQGFKLASNPTDPHHPSHFSNILNITSTVEKCERCNLARCAKGGFTHRIRISQLSKHSSHLFGPNGDPDTSILSWKVPKGLNLLNLFIATCNSQLSEGNLLQKIIKKNTTVQKHAFLEGGNLSVYHSQEHLIICVAITTDWQPLNTLRGSSVTAASACASKTVFTPRCQPI